MRHRPRAVARVRALARPSFLLLSALVVYGATLAAQQRAPVGALRNVPVPRPSNLSQFVRDESALVVLGKALFWDVQVGSDGRTACATCHFHAGADHRSMNQLADPPDSAVGTVPNVALTSDDFPFHAFANPLSNNSALVRSRRQVVGSAGIPQRTFVDVTAGDAYELSAEATRVGAFAIGNVLTRQVTARNAPSVINAVFNVRNFWDGRANHIYTGATPFGVSDERSNVLIARGSVLEPVLVRLDRSSLASQASGPPVNSVEMAFDGRSWPSLGKKMLPLVPLERQRVALDDSVLGPHVNRRGLGLAPGITYESLVRAAFRPEYWQSTALVDVDGRTLAATGTTRFSGDFTQSMYNFALFFGIAVQAYESTLVSDDTPVDRFLLGDAQALSAVERRGLDVLNTNQSQCNRCHQGPETTAAGITTATDPAATDPRALGLFRTGVSAIGDDAGAAGRDGFGRPLFTDTRASGAFKSPGLRNVELTGPYFHNGGASTLEQVVEFYARNGDVPAGGNLGQGIGNIQLNTQGRSDLVAVLKALTDERVRFERAPFDHPSLCVPVGHLQSASGSLLPDSSPEAVPGAAADRWALVPAVGSGGDAVPLQTFDELLRGIGADGSRAHTMQQSCEP